MTDYESRHGEYADWSDLKRVGVLKRLHRIIKDHTLRGITVTVNCDAYDELITGERRRTFGKKYFGSRGHSIVLAVLRVTPFLIWFGGGLIWRGWISLSSDSFVEVHL